MKKILFCLQTMVMGGVENRLIDILNRFDENKYEITVCLLYIQDQSMVDKLPDYVKVVNLNINREYYCAGIFSLVKERIKTKEYFEALRLLFLKILNIGITSGNVDISSIHELDETYDYAMCFHIHSPISLRYVVEKINAKTKYAWIRSDFKKTCYKINKYKNWLTKLDTVFGLSKEVCNEFTELCPELKEKTQVLYNLYDYKKIIENSLKTNEIDNIFLNDENFKILTVGRISREKGFNIAVEAAKLLKENNIKFTWYAIGNGNEFNNIKDLIVKYKLEDNFILLGRKDNPYPYMANCDIYVQPSISEGYCGTIIEAKTLKKLIVATNFTSIHEQINNGINGIVIDNFSPKLLSESIKKLINDSNYRETIINNIKNEDIIDNWKDIEEIFNR